MNELLGSVIKKKLSLNHSVKNEEINKQYLEKQNEENCVIIKSIQKNLEELRELRKERQLFQEKISLERRKNLELFDKFEKIYEENLKLKDELNKTNRENLLKENIVKENFVKDNNLIENKNKRKLVDVVLVE